jgi:hypothetical protein
MSGVSTISFATDIVFIIHSEGKGKDFDRLPNSE